MTGTQKGLPGGQDGGGAAIQVCPKEVPDGTKNRWEEAPGRQGHERSHGVQSVGVRDDRRKVTRAQLRITPWLFSVVLIYWCL